MRRAKYLIIKSLQKTQTHPQGEIEELIDILETDPIQGTSLGSDCYKIRVAIRSKGKGKSGGARVITCVKIVNNNVYLLSIFDKSDKENISDNELKELIKNL